VFGIEVGYSTRARILGRTTAAVTASCAGAIDHCGWARPPPKGLEAPALRREVAESGVHCDQDGSRVSG
jgi:hypothetical protein